MSREYSWDAMGMLSGVCQSDGGDSQDLLLWVNALGLLQGAGGRQLVWDTAGFVPAVASWDGEASGSLPSPVGAGWGANPYAFLGNDPVNLLDPWGLSPVSVQEMEEYQAANPTWVGAVKNWANEHADVIATVAMVAGAALTVAALVATGPVGLIVAGAAGGAFLSGGLSILMNKGEDGQVDWKKVGLDTLIGGLAGGVGGAAVYAVSKVGSALNLSRGLSHARLATSYSDRAQWLGSAAASASRFNPMRYVNSARAAGAADNAAIHTQIAAGHYARAGQLGDVGSFARTLPGQTVYGVSSNVAGNNLAYATGGFEERTVGGYIRATVSGVGVGVISPRLTPLRQSNTVHLKGLSGNLINSKIGGLFADRVGDFILGAGNYLINPQEESVNREDLLKDGFKSAISGGVGAAGTAGAAKINPDSP